MTPVSGSSSEKPIAEPPPLDPRRASILLLLLAGAALIVSYVETMLVPALPTLAHYFGGVPYTTIAWVVSAYLLVGVSTIPLVAKMGDLYGKRRMMLVVLGIYAVAVILAGLTGPLATLLGLSRTNSVYLLVGIRGLQGVGISLFPLALSMVGEELPAARVGPAQGMIAAMFAIGSSLGLFAGSWLIQSYGWEFAYRTVIPLALGLLGLSLWALPESRHRLQARLDVAGSALLGSSLATFLLALSLAPSWGWGNLYALGAGKFPLGVPQLLVLSGLLVLGFYLWERRTSDPLLHLSRFAENGLGISLTAILLVGVAMFIGFVSLTILVETPVVGFGESIFSFGVLSLPTTLGMFTAAPFVGRAIGRYGPRPVALFGSALATTGYVLLLAFHQSYLEVMVMAIPLFVGLVALLISITNLVVLTSRRGESGIQTGLVEMFQDLGSSIGPVIAAVVLSSLTATYYSPGAGPAGVQAVALPTHSAFDLLFVIGIALTVTVGGLVSRLRNPRAQEAEAEARQPSSPSPTPGKPTPEA